MTSDPGTTTVTLQVRQKLGKTLLRGGSLIKRFIVRTVLGKAPRPALDPPVESLARYPVVAYFAESSVRYYQLRQWLPVLEQVARTYPVLIVTRSWGTTQRLREETSLPVAYTSSLDGLISIYAQVDAKTVVYVNNGMRNFQSLIYRQALHVHVNHGESDKVSMVSNQAKAYDHVVVAGPAAIERHRRALINFDLDRLVVCGRPQLDLDIVPSVEALPGARTVLYAPTWSGENEANNYTSLDHYGPSIVRALLSQPDTRVLYKPHPRVLTTQIPEVAAAHEQIMELMAAANEAAGHERHLLPFDHDILALFDTVDLLVTDISSVGLDFLYLRPDAPIILTDRRTDREHLLHDAPIARATDVIDASTVGDVEALVAANLEHDPRHTVRAELRDHYFGFARGESSARFLTFLGECVGRRDAEIGGVETEQPGASDTDESDRSVVEG